MITLNNLSAEQQNLVHLALEGKNILCDACIGSGKTSTINVLCNEFESSKRILYLTYNRLLKLDAQDKIVKSNVIVQNYHGFASKILYRKKIRNIGQGEQIDMVLKKRVPVGRFDVLIIDEYQDINEEIAKLLLYIKDSNPSLQIIAVGDMKQKIYDTTSLDIWSFIHKFLGKHVQVNFTQCFRLSHDLAQRLGTIWDKEINGVNKNCKVTTMTKREVVDFLDEQNPKDVLCLGARNGPMVSVLNELEERPGNLYDKNHVYASIKDTDGARSVAPGSDVGIFTTYDGSKGMERPICVVFDFDDKYWQMRLNQPMARYEILRNLFCVAASRGKDEVIFVKPEKSHLVKDKTLMTPSKSEANFGAFDIEEMFDFKFDEDVKKCYSLITDTPILHKDNHRIEMKHADALIDLSPCIDIYQQANFFDYYDIDSAIAYYMYLHREKRVVLPNDWKSVEQKVLFLTMLMTSQDRYVKQVSLPFITKEQERELNNRLSVEFSPVETVQERCEITAVVDKEIIIEDDEEREKNIELKISGMADVVKDNKVYLLKFVSALAHKHFLQCACYMLATGLPKGILWNVYDNTMYEVEIPDRNKFMDAVIQCITKQTYPCALSYHVSKDYTQDLDTILDQIMSDDSLPEFDGSGNVKEEETPDEGISIIKRGEQYIIVDAANRQILDTSAVNGYDSILAACEDYVRKNKEKVAENTGRKKLLSNIEDWLDSHSAFETDMGIVEQQVENHTGPYSSYSSFSTYVIRKMLKDQGLVINFEERQLLKVYKARKKKREQASSVSKAAANKTSSKNEALKSRPTEAHTTHQTHSVSKKPDWHVICSSELSKTGDIRYIVVQNTTNNVLDDANGYGYKSIQAAYRAYNYKQHLPKNSAASESKVKTTKPEQLTFGEV